MDCDKQGILKPDLSVRRKVPAKANGDPIRVAGAGNVAGMYTGGRATSKRKKLRQCYPMIQDQFPAYLMSLTRLQIAALVSELCLMPPKEDGTYYSKAEVKRRGSAELLQTLVDFHESPQEYRQELDSFRHTTH